MLNATSLSFGYHEGEDRIVLTATGADGLVMLLLTRRIARNLLRGFADVLLQTSTAVRGAPVDLRLDVIVIEHEGAIANTPAAAAAAVTGGAGGPVAVPAGAPAPRPGPPTLATKVDVTVEPRRFVLTVHDASGPRVAAAAARSDFHRLLAALDRLSEKAGWDIRAGAGWLPHIGRPVPAGQKLS